MKYVLLQTIRPSYELMEGLGWERLTKNVVKDLFLQVKAAS